MSMSGPASDLATAIAAYASLAATQNYTTLNGTTITGNGGVNVISASSISGGVTLNGSASDYFMVKVSNSVDFEGASGVSLTGGLTANHVLFDVAGNIKLGGSNTVSGTFISTSGTIEIGGSSTINGALLDLKSSVSFDVKTDSSMTLNGTGNLFSAPISAPEPSPLVKGISGLVSIGLWGVVRRRRLKRAG